MKNDNLTSVLSERSAKNAIITGASSGIGNAIAAMLLRKGWNVYAPARREFNAPEVSGRLIRIPCDLSDSGSVRSCIRRILEEADTIDLLVNCAGIGRFGPHEQMKAEDISGMIRVNLEAPILLCALTLRALKASKGKIINISSVTAEKDSVFGCAYAATKAGLSHFSDSLFEEVRKSGVGVTVIQPDLTRTEFYDHLDFEPDPDPLAAIWPEQVADHVAYVIDTPDNLSVGKITLRPQINKILRKTGDARKASH